MLALGMIEVYGRIEDEEAALLLLQAGADAGVVNNEGVTPLWGASAIGMPRVVSALLERGAKPQCPHGGHDAFAHSDGGRAFEA